MASALVTARSAAPAVSRARSRGPRHAASTPPLALGLPPNRRRSPKRRPLDDASPPRRRTARRRRRRRPRATTRRKSPSRSPSGPSTSASSTLFSPPPAPYALRGMFETHNDDPRRVHEYRFVWDYWHVPGQYTQLRTPAADYFPKEQFEALEEALLTYARETLGCSCDGASVAVRLRQWDASGDRAGVPRGPFAFVLSLTNWDKRRFTGGRRFFCDPKRWTTGEVRDVLGGGARRRRPNPWSPRFRG